MDHLKWILLGFLIIGLFNTGFSKTTLSPEGDYEEIPQEDEDDYADEDLSKNNEAIQNNDVAIVTAPPSYFVVPSVTINATKGDDVILHCDARNLPANPIIMWYNGSLVIVTNKNVINRDKIELIDETKIKIRNVEYSDRNQYLCSVLPHQVNLTILLNVFQEKRAAVIYSHGRDVTERSMTFRQGERVEFECRIFGIEKYSIIWSLNGERASNHVTSDENGKIVISSIDENHAGIYQCVGDDGSKNNLPVASLAINVHYSPKISTHRHYVNVKEGGNAELDCDYKSEPIAITEWRKHHIGYFEPITYSEKYLIKHTVHKGKNTTTLHIRDINSEDIGEYQCYVKNSLGSAHANIHLIYEPEKPRFEKYEFNPNNKTVTFNWLVRSMQPIVEAVVDYKINGTHNKWTTESITKTHPHDPHSGIWKLTHHLELPAGTWHVRIKVKNTIDWSKFSDEKIVVINDSLDTEVPPAPEDIVYAGDIGGKIKSNNNNSNQLIASVPLLLILCLLSTLRIVPSI